MEWGIGKWNFPAFPFEIITMPPDETRIWTNEGKGQSDDDNEKYYKYVCITTIPTLTLTLTQTLLLNIMQ